MICGSALRRSIRNELDESVVEQFCLGVVVIYIRIALTPLLFKRGSVRKT
jgi:hypothetical protein